MRDKASGAERNGEEEIGENRGFEEGEEGGSFVLFVAKRFVPPPPRT